MGMDMRYPSKVYLCRFSIYLDQLNTESTIAHSPREYSAQASYLTHVTPSRSSTTTSDLLA